MPWSTKFYLMSDKECTKFLYDYLQNFPNGETFSEKYITAYKDTLGYIVGGIMVGATFKAVSNKAAESLKRNDLENLRPIDTYEGFIREHIIPISCVTDYIYTKILGSENTSKAKVKLTETDLSDLIKAVRGLALITTEEDDKLNKNYKSSLPNNHSIDDLLKAPSLFYERYEKTMIGFKKIY